MIMIQNSRIKRCNGKKEAYLSQYQETVLGNIDASISTAYTNIAELIEYAIYKGFIDVNA